MKEIFVGTHCKRALASRTTTYITNCEGCEHVENLMNFQQSVLICIFRA